MKVLCLAAGFATRMWPLTREHPKALLEVGGRPVLSRTGDRLRELDGVDEMLIASNERFYRRFVRWSDTVELGFPVRVVSNGVRDPEGARGANVDLAVLWERAASGEGGGTDVLVVAGDNLHSADLRPAQARFRATGLATVLCRRLQPPLPPRLYGEVVIDATEHVTSFREKPADPRSPLAATCTYFFPASVREDLRAYLAGGGLPDANGHFLAWLAPRRPLRAELLGGAFFDIGSLETLERARRELAT